MRQPDQPDVSITSHDVARMASVSQATVSRALRGDPRVSEATRERVRSAAAALRYVPNYLGRSMATRSTRQVAIVADLDNTLYPLLMAPLHDRFAERGYRVVLVATRSENAADYEHLFNQSVDAAVLTTTSLGSVIPEMLAARKLPFVELNRVSGRTDVDTVVADNRAGARELAQLLVDGGHRRIAALLGPAETSTSRDRELGLRDALDAAGIALPPHRVWRGEYSYEDGSAGFAHVMAGRHRPTAVFCASDVIAIGAVNQARSMALDVPADVSVVGFDDLPIASWPGFEVTTQRVDMNELASAAAQIILDRLEGDTAPTRRHVFPTTLVVRHTYAPLG